MPVVNEIKHFVNVWCCSDELDMQCVSRTENTVVHMFEARCTLLTVVGLRSPPGTPQSY